MILSLSLCPLSRSSLFPYTTLFRSPVLLQHRSAPSAVDDDRLVSLAERRDIRPGECRGVRRGRRADRRQQDRKSTRLNSSHMSISYAVFCLKKKKKNQPYYID